MSEHDTENPANPLTPSLSDIVTGLESQVGDILGELDHIAQTSKDSDRVRALSAKLRHLEMKRHHVETLHRDSMFRESVAIAIHKLGDNLDLLLKEQREHRHAPGHVVTRFSGMGIKAEVSGKEDDPHYVELSDLIGKLSSAITNLKEKVVTTDLEEMQKGQAHDRALRQQHMDQATGATESCD